MPIYEPDHVEYKTSHGHISIVLDGGQQLPAYFAHPELGLQFPGVVLIHDWWGVTTIIRRIANLYAQMGYYVIVPDLFNGQVAKNAQHAMKLVKALGADGGYPLVDSALGVLEHHHQCNAYVAAVGVGMGGSLAFQAAIERHDIEAAVVYSGFPQKYFGRLAEAHVPILAFYGSLEPYVKPAVIHKLRTELKKSKHPHDIRIVEGLGHEFFVEDMPHEHKLKSRDVLKESLDFLDTHLDGPERPQKRQVF